MLRFYKSKGCKDSDQSLAVNKIIYSMDQKNRKKDSCSQFLSLMHWHFCLADADIIGKRNPESN